MQTTNKSCRIGLRIVAFFAVLVIINICLSFLLCPLENASGKVWYAYNSEQNDIDTLFVGSSLIACSVNPYEYDAIANTRSFNFGTPCQHVNQSIEAIETVISDCELKTIVLAVDYGELTQPVNINAKAAFQQAKVSTLNPIEKAGYFCKQAFARDSIMNPESINYFIPWIYNNVSISPSLILSNVQAKISGKTDILGDDYVGRGYSTNDKNLPENGEILQQNHWDEYGAFNTDTISIIIDLIQLCNSRDIRLILVVPPHPRFDIVDYLPSYYSYYAELSQILGEYEVEFYDFNFAIPEYFTFDPQYFSDFEHLNTLGATEFSRMLAKFLQQSKENDMSSCFYEYDEYVNVVLKQQG